MSLSCPPVKKWHSKCAVLAQFDTSSDKALNKFETLRFPNLDYDWESDKVVLLRYVETEGRSFKSSPTIDE